MYDCGVPTNGSLTLVEQRHCQAPELIGRDPNVGRGRGAQTTAATNGPEDAATPRPRLANEAVVTADRPHPPVELGAVAARWEPRCSGRPCHPRAVSSGHQRYPAVNHGHAVRGVALGAAP
jgi:hypothetical protein